MGVIGAGRVHRGKHLCHVVESVILMESVTMGCGRWNRN